MKEIKLASKKLKVVLLVGGASTEREVSKLSSRAIYSALKNLGHDVALIDPAYGMNQPELTEDFFKTGEMFEISPANYFKCLERKEFRNVDLAFIGLHGRWGEDGAIQSLLEMIELPYTGSGVLASSVSMDKDYTKIILKEHGVNVADGLLIKKNFLLDEVKKKARNFSYPIVVKPNDQGSTFGLTVCREESQLEAAIHLSFKYSNSTLIEKFIEGREMTVSIVGDEVLPVIEIVPSHELYDYECKYTKGMSQYFVPADIPELVAKKMQEETRIAFNALRCEGYARVDFRLTNDFKTYCLELNSLPGMTETSLVPKAAKAAGYSFDALIEKIIYLSLK